MSKEIEGHLYYLNLVKDSLGFAQVEVRDALEWAVETLKSLESLIEEFTDGQA